MTIEFLRRLNDFIEMQSSIAESSLPHESILITSGIKRMEALIASEYFVTGSVTNPQSVSNFESASKSLFLPPTKRSLQKLFNFFDVFIFPMSGKDGPAMQTANYTTVILLLHFGLVIPADVIHVSVIDVASLHFMNSKNADVFSYLRHQYCYLIQIISKIVRCIRFPAGITETLRLS